MFDTITGSYTVYDTAGITSAAALDVAIDELKNWTITIDTTSYVITGNEDDTVDFVNALDDVGNFSIDYCTRSDLAKIEDEISSSVKFPDTLVNNKIEVTKNHFYQKIKAAFKNLYTEYSDVDDPMSLIINLGEVKTAFIYYCIAECYSDTTLVSDDMNVYNEEKYRNKYKEIINDSMSLLAVDSSQSGELSNLDKGSSPAKGVLLSR